MKTISLNIIFLISTICVVGQYSTDNTDQSKMILINVNQQFDSCEIVIKRIQGIDIAYFKYYCDNELCNGNKVSYWDNGQIHYKGSFKDGLPFDTIKEFDRSGKILDWRYIDSLEVSWHFDTSGNLMFSSNKRKEIIGGGVPNEQTYYNENKRKTKTISVTSPPSSYSETVSYYDSSENVSFIVSTDFTFARILKPKFYQYLIQHDSLRQMEIYELQLVNQSKYIIVNQRFYKTPPADYSDVIEESIIGEFLIKKNTIFILDRKNGKYIKVKRIKSA